MHVDQWPPFQRASNLRATEVGLWQFSSKHEGTRQLGGIGRKRFLHLLPCKEAEPQRQGAGGLRICLQHLKLEVICSSCRRQSTRWSAGLTPQWPEGLRSHCHASAWRLRRYMRVLTSNVVATKCSSPEAAGNHVALLQKHGFTRVTEGQVAQLASQLTWTWTAVAAGRIILGGPQGDSQPTSKGRRRLILSEASRRPSAQGGTAWFGANSCRRHAFEVVTVALFCLQRWICEGFGPAPPLLESNP
mmetsp:Transcript_101935/g.243009  ORF Transcript_101935/g.243009 Transcript_101935/m.243009 type:complete len:246 (-) Transcript_101935:147-884(-)